MQSNFSIEFFPPKSAEGMANLKEACSQLVQLGATHFSVTHGAGGTALNGNDAAVSEVQQVGGRVAPHVLCIESTRETIRAKLQEYRQKGVSHVVALRGDIADGAHAEREFKYADALVSFVRAETGDEFRIDVGAYPEMHPEAASPQQDLENFVRKMQAGADAAITQYFYNADAYFRFRDAAAKLGVTAPIIPGIMPISNYKQLARFSDMCGAEIPRWLRLRLSAYEDDLASLRAFGVDVVTELCERLRAGGVSDFHFYSLNRAEYTAKIWRNLTR